MAQHLDLEEQEQIAEFKHFWNKYGNLITGVLIVVLAAYSGWNGWQYWQRKTALEATALLDEMEHSAQAKESDKVRRVWGDMQSQVPRTVQLQYAGLLAAKVMVEEGKPEDARAALKVVVESTQDAGLSAVARLRLAALELDAKAYDAALKWLDAPLPTAFAGLVADRRGDVLQAQGKADEARKAYQQAYDAAKDDVEFRHILEAKLNALGVNPDAAVSE